MIAVLLIGVTTLALLLASAHNDRQSRRNRSTGATRKEQP